MIRSIMLVFILFSLVSCKVNEKKLMSYSLKVKTHKLQFTKMYSDDGLIMNSLVSLKEYSDSYSLLASSLKELVKRKKGRRGLLKYLKSLNELDTLCSSHNLSSEVYESVLKSCNEGHFNICPLNFARFKANRKILLEALATVNDTSIYEKTDCELEE